MAPKGSKRQGSGADAPAAKRKRQQKRQDSVVDALNEAESLSESCRCMLAGALPGSLGVAPAERDFIQNRLVELLGQAMNGEGSRIQSVSSAADAEVTTVAAETAQSDSAVRAFEESLAANAADITTKAEKSQADTQAEEKTIELAQAAKDAVENFEGELKVISDEKAGVERVSAEDLTPLKEGSTLTKREVNAHVRSVQKACESFGLDEALLVALSSTLAKPAANRGPFDQVVMEQIDLAFARETHTRQARLDGSAQENSEKSAAMESTRVAQEAATAQRIASEEAEATARAEKVCVEKQLKDEQQKGKDLAKRSKHVASDAARKAKHVASFHEVSEAFGVERDGEPAAPPTPEPAPADASSLAAEPTM